MENLVSSFYKNSRLPSPDEIMAVLSDKLDELSSLISAVGETGMELPDFESILIQIRSTLETSHDTKQVDLLLPYHAIYILKCRYTEVRSDNMPKYWIISQLFSM